MYISSYQLFKFQDTHVIFLTFPNPLTYFLTISSSGKIKWWQRSGLCSMFLFMSFHFHCISLPNLFTKKRKRKSNYNHGVSVSVITYIYVDSYNVDRKQIQAGDGGCLFISFCIMILCQFCI